MNKVERLIKYFRPSHYELELHVDKNQKTITGKVLVTGEAVANTVKLHAKDMQIERVVCESREIKTFHEGDILTLHGISRGFTQFTIEFKLKLTGSMHGAYLSTYKLGGKTETIVTTQFESHYARECFPCVDEPEAKAVFELTITTPDTDDTVISNMPSHLEVDKHGSAPVLKATFEPTPRMSTYLLAFCVGAFQKLSGKTKHGVDVNVYATPAQAPDSLSFALDIATRSLDFYEDYFDVPYPLPKSDHVALPDFEAGAMENWGLVTYREACLLADPKLTPIEAQRSIATTIAHELAHMWFGDLVTMKWWDDLWLNESFATMIEYVAIDALEPSWQIWQDFETSCTVSSLRRDAMDGVQPVYQDVSHPDEIQSLFDPSIVYAKGARLMHMLVHMMGEAAFRRGLKKYFNKHEYGSAVGDDLWAALGSETNLDIRDFMKQWIDRPGYPVVSVRLEEGKITLEQHRFSLGKAPDMTWPIPLDANLDILPKVFDTRKLVVEDESIGPDTLVHVNQSRTGQILVNYDTASLQNLLGSIDVADSGACLGLLTE
ncbi:MAG: M1 family metallopeptidase, partial [Candidatus Nomurabacteria bacterium]|nr:M1 family metallopeptidase [Candidatus Nomurabacteria bacterium]